MVHRRANCRVMHEHLCAVAICLSKVQARGFRFDRIYDGVTAVVLQLSVVFLIFKKFATLADPARALTLQQCSKVFQPICCSYTIPGTYLLGSLGDETRQISSMFLRILSSPNPCAACDLAPSLFRLAMRLPSGASAVTVEAQDHQESRGRRRKALRARFGALFRGSGEDTKLEVGHF